MAIMLFWVGEARVWVCLFVFYYKVFVTDEVPQKTTLRSKMAVHVWSTVKPWEVWLSPKTATEWLRRALWDSFTRLSKFLLFNLMKENTALDHIVPCRYLSNLTLQTFSYLRKEFITRTSCSYSMDCISQFKPNSFYLQFMPIIFFS